MILYVILYIFFVAFLFSGILFFMNASTLCKRYNKQYDNVYADIAEVKEGDKK